MQWRRDYDQRLLQRHVQFVPACPAGKRRALRQQSEFDNAARNDRVRKTLVALPSAPTSRPHHHPPRPSTAPQRPPPPLPPAPPRPHPPPPLHADQRPLKHIHATP